MPPRPPMSEREFAVEVVRTLRDAGHEALFAGGCVRDELLGLVPKDHDVATSARPEQVQRLFRRTVAVGASFGVIEVLGPRPYRIEVATFRTDGTYSDARRPDSVVFSNAEEDAKRRDFTINGMFLDPLADRVIDHVGGREDLQAKVLRAIGDPYARFGEDRLRILRGVRVAARFELTIEPHTSQAMEERAATLAEGVSAERIAEELRKILTGRNRSRAMRLFMDLGLAAVVMPELVPMRGLPQGPPRAEATLPAPGMPGPPLPGDLWEHTCAVLDELPDAPTFPLAMAALLHDAGKPRTVGRTPERYTFHGHEHVGRRMAEEIGARLKLSNDERERIEWLVEKHQVLADAPKMKPAKLKGLLVHPGIEELIALHRADARASGRDEEAIDHAVRLREQWDREGTLSPSPLLTGNDLLDMGVPQGPVFKVLLEKVREAQLDGTIRAKDEARELARRLLTGDAQP